MASHIKSIHHPITFTEQEGIMCLKKVISAIETYDVTTVRASVPMWIMAREIKKYGIKFVLSGEGSDELFGGYTYFWHCPSSHAMAQECSDKLNMLWSYDCLRANKAMGDFGIEARVPFLDKDILSFGMNILDPVHKLSHSHPDGKRAEKWFLRETFSELLPVEVSSRTKAQFSDAVGSAWIDALKTHAESQVTDSMMQRARRRFPHQTPTTKEAYLYRHIFTQIVGGNSSRAVLYEPTSIACSTGAGAKWCPGFKHDPSGILERLDSV